MNLLKTKLGRLVAFGGLYLSEGLPQGFTGVALALEFKRRGMDAAALGAFAGTILLPWSWKFLMGPLVDNLYFKRFGARKQWIVMAQVGMLLTLCLAMFNLPVFEASGEVVGLSLFTVLLVIHNVFAATQDVAIDALACSVLKKSERGLANGVMFGAATAGQALGGSGVIFLKGRLESFETSAFIVPLLLAGVLTMVITSICEKSAAEEMADGELLSAEDDPKHDSDDKVAAQIYAYSVTVFKTFFLTRRGFLGMVLALLPFGGMAISMTVSTILTPSLGMSDDEIAFMGLVGTLLFVPFCLLGGWLSDRFDRRVILSICCVLSVVPGLWMAQQLGQAGWEYMPEGVDGVWERNESLIQSWWIASMVFSVFFGLLYGIKSAFFMDIVNPKIAGTHFTAMMAMSNLVIAYTYYWEGKALGSVESGGWGWTNSTIFLVDSIFGCAFLLVIPFVKPRQISDEDLPDL